MKSTVQSLFSEVQFVMTDELSCITNGDSLKGPVLEASRSPSFANMQELKQRLNDGLMEKQKQNKPTVKRR